MSIAEVAMRRTSLVCPAACFSTKWSASSGMSVLRSRSGGR
jgi:hypothetical protein